MEFFTACCMMFFSITAVGLMAFAVFAIGYILKEKGNFNGISRITKPLKIFAVGFIGLFGFEYISNQMGRSDDSKLIDSLFKEVSFVFSNFKVLIDNMELNNMRFFKDIVFYPLFLLPSRIWRTILPDTASDIITIFVYGSKKGVGDVYGEVPIDSISMGYIQFGVIGVIVFAVFFAYFIAKLLNIVFDISNNKIRNTLVIYITLDVVIRSIFYADSYGVVKRIFPLIVFGLIYWAVGLIRREK